MLSSCSEGYLVPVGVFCDSGVITSQSSCEGQECLIQIPGLQCRQTHRSMSSYKILLINYVTIKCYPWFVYFSMLIRVSGSKLCKSHLISVWKKNTGKWSAYFCIFLKIYYNLSTLEPEAFHSSAPAEMSSQFFRKCLPVILLDLYNTTLMLREAESPI